MAIVEKTVKSILTHSQIYDYTINPYIGCQHGCLYCYAKFMKRFTGHGEAWGTFVDVKMNAPELLQKEISRRKRGAIWMSGVCDPYQPIEEKYRLTRRCLEILVQYDWPIVIQSRSPLVLRDIDLLQRIPNLEVGLSIPTANDDVRRLFEPKAPPIQQRIDSLGKLREAGVRTFAMIAPILPDTENLLAALIGKVSYILLDRMNYGGAHSVYQSHGWLEKSTDAYFIQTRNSFNRECRKLGIECRSVF